MWGKGPRGCSCASTTPAQSLKMCRLCRRGRLQIEGACLALVCGLLMCSVAHVVSFKVQPGQTSQRRHVVEELWQVVTGGAMEGEFTEAGLEGQGNGAGQEEPTEPIKRSRAAEME